MNKLLILLIVPQIIVAQFAPPVGQVGTTAMYKDSSAFVDWASSCEVVLGYVNIANPSLGYASAGSADLVPGIAGDNEIVSLGDGGYAIVQFSSPIKNGASFDFAVFENSFNDSFLELAFVEVSSDGVNFFRFPATSNTQTQFQVVTYGFVDATLINNLAGKYRGLYGTPFDLEELKNEAGLDVNSITHVKILDAVGSVEDEYATFDKNGNKINFPWPTPFESSGFDLDAVGVIHNQVNSLEQNLNVSELQLYPNPLKNQVNIAFNNKNITINKIEFTDISGKLCLTQECTHLNAITLNTSELNNGVYFIVIYTNQGKISQKISVQHD
jgi:hypothetical protein